MRHILIASSPSKDSWFWLQVLQALDLIAAMRPSAIKAFAVGNERSPKKRMKLISEIIGALKAAEQPLLSQLKSFLTKLCGGETLNPLSLAPQMNMSPGEAESVGLFSARMAARELPVAVALLKPGEEVDRLCVVMDVLTSFSRSFASEDVFVTGFCLSMYFFNVVEVLFNFFAMYFFNVVEVLFNFVCDVLFQCR
ncbi:hypothetical protein MHBO_004404 [Bonamia ostreae]|uniref:Uncharacterized protein n=1 Tax=Bonamia ostreae TaxID=126728 RepID=A0ABV2AT92_9EUKA